MRSFASWLPVLIGAGAVVLVVANIVTVLAVNSPGPAKPPAAPRPTLAGFAESAPPAPPAVDAAAPSASVIVAERKADEAPPSAEEETYIAAIHLSLDSPMHAVTLEWTGPGADEMPTGPFHSSPGAGLGFNNCDDPAESNRDGSNCTPKGDFVVLGFSDKLPSYDFCRYVTWFDFDRGIAFHSHYQVPRYPASHGCVRMYGRDAKLIHDNSRKGVTTVHVTGSWRRR